MMSYYGTYDYKDAADYPHLEGWQHPANYGGQTWYGWYIVAGQHRDSDLLTQSNFDGLKALLLPLATDAPSDLDEPNLPRGYGDTPDDDTFSTVQVVCNNHWAVGWIEFIAIHQSNTAALEKAEELAAALADYPVLDEEDFSRREHEQACEYWEHASVRERVEIIQRYAQEDTSVFAARRDDLPSDWGIREYLNTP